MTKRERVERTMERKEVDRIPIYDILACDSAIEYFSGEKIPSLSKDPQLEEKLLRIVGRGVDKLLDMTRSVGFGPVVEEDTTDTYGFVYHSNPKEKTTWIVKRPFRDEEGAIAFIKRRIRGLEEEIESIKKEGDAYREKYHRDFLKTQSAIGDTVNLLSQDGTGLDDLNRLLGLELFSYILADEPAWISEFMEVSTARNITVCHIIADKDLSPCVLTYGDIACKKRLLYKPDFLRKEFFPRLKRINDAWHHYGIKCLFHSDGYLMEVMDDLIGTGIDGLNPMEIVAGMDIKEIKEKYGERIFLTGGIDMSQLLSFGTPEEVKEVCRRAINDAYPGYFIGSTTELDNSAKLENIIAMYEVVYYEGVPG